MSSNDVEAVLRARLDARGVRELVEWDTLSAEQRLMEHGVRCPLDCTPYRFRLTITLDDDGNVHATHDWACPTCTEESSK